MTTAQQFRAIGHRSTRRSNRSELRDYRGSIRLDDEPTSSRRDDTAGNGRVSRSEYDPDADENNYIHLYPVPVTEQEQSALMWKLHRCEYCTHRLDSLMDRDDLSWLIWRHEDCAYNYTIADLDWHERDMMFLRHEYDRAKDEQAGEYYGDDPCNGSCCCCASSDAPADDEFSGLDEFVATLEFHAETRRLERNPYLSAPIVRRPGAERRELRRKHAARHNHQNHGDAASQNDFDDRDHFDSWRQHGIRFMERDGRHYTAAVIDNALYGDEPHWFKTWGRWSLVWVIIDDAEVEENDTGSLEADDRYEDEEMIEDEESLQARAVALTEVVLREAAKADLGTDDVIGALIAAGLIGRHCIGRPLDDCLFQALLAMPQPAAEEQGEGAVASDSFRMTPDENRPLIQHRGWDGRFIPMQPAGDDEADITDSDGTTPRTVSSYSIAVSLAELRSPKPCPVTIS